MDETKFALTRHKYQLPYHWIRDPLQNQSLPYFGYIQLILDELPQPPALVLDAGCGDGRISSEMVYRGYEVTGIDYLDISITYAKTLVPEGRFLVADLRGNLPQDYGLQEESFDAVILIEVYEHIPPEACPVILANLYKLLKPGGIMIVSVPSNKIPQSRLHYRHFDHGEFVEELERANFKLKKVIFQHRVDGLTNWFLSDGVERLLSNRWLQPVFLKRLRRYWYMTYANRVEDDQRCGRYIAVVEK